MTKNPIRRQALEYVRQAQRVGENVTFKEFTEKTMQERWKTNKYGGSKLASVPQIGGQQPGQGADILKYIKKHDPQNEAGSVQQGLDMMLKMQAATESPTLSPSIQPLYSILGGNLYGAMKSSNSKSKAQKKTQKTKKLPSNTDIFIPDPALGASSIEEEDEEEYPQEWIDLIDRAMDCVEKKSLDDLETAAEELDDREIENIGAALISGEEYVSEKMPQNFIQCIRDLIAAMRAIV